MHWLTQYLEKSAAAKEYYHLDKQLIFIIGFYQLRKYFIFKFPDNIGNFRFYNWKAYALSA